MENFVLDFVTLYGPLGFGWPAAIYIALQYKNQMRQTIIKDAEQQAILIKLIEENTAAMIALKTYIEAKVE